uniref:Uncharacterized protein n=1 Tax=Molossus molossus TaxID=27622 RepID=A0A7J8I9C2_MOLMO|nr:hypothetical protein HJG59_010526 [Molossus molossus]
MQGSGALVTAHLLGKSLKRLMQCLMSNRGPDRRRSANGGCTERAHQQNLTRRRGQNTSNLTSQPHCPDTKPRQKRGKKRQLQAQIPEEHKCKNLQQNEQTKFNNTLKGSYTLIEGDLFQRCKDSLTYAKIDDPPH